MILIGINVYHLTILLYFWITKTIGTLYVLYSYVYHPRTKKSLFKFQIESQFSSNTVGIMREKGERKRVAIKKLDINGYLLPRMAYRKKQYRGRIASSCFLPRYEWSITIPVSFPPFRLSLCKGWINRGTSRPTSTPRNFEKTTSHGRDCSTGSIVLLD